MEFDYSKLRGIIKEKFENEYVFAGEMGITPTSLSMKLNNLRHFSQAQILTASSLLEISLNDIGLYFFNEFAKFS